MRLFSLLDFQYFVLAFFLGLISVSLIYLAFRGVQREMEEPRVETEYPEGIKVTRHPTPSLLIFVYVGFVVWAFVYTIFIGIFGGTSL